MLICIVRSYLKAESVAKKKEEYDMSHWECVNIKVSVIFTLIRILVGIVIRKTGENSYKNIYMNSDKK